MPLPLLLLILLAFPVVEIWLLIELAGRYGVWVLLYLVVVAILGWRLIQDEKLMLGRMTQTLSQGGAPARALFSGAKNMLAGILLIIPGVVTDAIAVILLLLPSAKPEVFDQTVQPEPRQSRRPQAANDDVIEGEYTRED
ncbi:FxsA family protein [Methylovorus menthalis]|uniref:FxsA family protein n=1 Tax=Methylovorus menthalis TaxID=1002227 RepID=UPI001E5E1CF2|nr:FxsA family protein [Methylovorus menthalis]MCB4810146.1 FxsA family protein [Methylovorus menthalis]